MENKLTGKEKKQPVKLPILVDQINNEELFLAVRKEKWNIASVLSRLAFWDEWRHPLAGKCRDCRVTPPPLIEPSAIDLINRHLRL